MADSPMVEVGRSDGLMATFLPSLFFSFSKWLPPVDGSHLRSVVKCSSSLAFHPSVLPPSSSSFSIYTFASFEEEEKRVAFLSLFSTTSSCLYLTVPLGQ
jgi:hypothetical protein